MGIIQQMEQSALDAAVDAIAAAMPDAPAVNVELAAQLVTEAVRPFLLDIQLVQAALDARNPEPSRTRRPHFTASHLWSHAAGDEATFVDLMLSKGGLVLSTIQPEVGTGGPGVRETAEVPS